GSGRSGSPSAPVTSWPWPIPAGPTGSWSSASPGSRGAGWSSGATTPRPAPTAATSGPWIRPPSSAGWSTATTPRPGGAAWGEVVGLTGGSGRRHHAAYPLRVPPRGRPGGRLVPAGAGTLLIGPGREVAWGVEPTPS